MRHGINFSKSLSSSLQHSRSTAAADAPELERSFLCGIRVATFASRSVANLAILRW